MLFWLLPLGRSQDNTTHVCVGDMEDRGPGGGGVDDGDQQKKRSNMMMRDPRAKAPGGGEGKGG